MIRILVLATLALSACAAPAPSRSFPPPSVDLEIVVEHDDGPFAPVLEPRFSAALFADDGTVVDQWGLATGAPQRRRVPPGPFTLEASVIFLSDAFQCTADPASGRESCFQPTLGPHGVCRLQVDFQPNTAAHAIYRLDREARCALTAAP